MWQSNNNKTIYIINLSLLWQSARFHGIINPKKKTGMKRLIHIFIISESVLWNINVLDIQAGGLRIQAKPNPSTLLLIE